MLHQLYFVQRDGLSGIKSALLAFALVWLVMSMVLFFFKIQCRVPYPVWVSRFRTFEGVLFYQQLGVRAFRWLLLHSPFRFANTQIYLHQSRSKQSVELLHRRMLEAEWAHIINVLLVFIATFVYQEIAFWLLVWNVVFNLYPIFLQRYNRLRISRLHN